MNTTPNAANATRPRTGEREGEGDSDREQHLLARWTSGDTSRGDGKEGDSQVGDDDGAMGRRVPPFLLPFPLCEILS